MFWVLKKIRAHFGHDQFSAKTFDRLIQSVHVEDLRWIAAVTAGGATLAFLLIVIVALTGTPNVSGDKVGLSSRLHDALVPFQISAVLAGLSGIIAWCYRTGSERLGIVDLVACEITTLCRICTINGLADTCIEAFALDSGEPIEADHTRISTLRERFSHFDSVENYAPVFESNAKELRNLGVKVVSNITAFYAYWKATRDAFRKLANTPAATTASGLTVATDPWHGAMRNVIYMQFLAFESARRSVRDLIEFEPNRAENTITILLSELPAYHFLLQHFPKGDVRYARLEERKSRYQSIVPQLYYGTEEAHGKLADTNEQLHRLPREELEELRRDWDKAYRMLTELKARYEAAFGEFPHRDTIALSEDIERVESPRSPGLSLVGSQ